MPNFLALTGVDPNDIIKTVNEDGLSGDSDTVLGTAARKLFAGNAGADFIGGGGNQDYLLGNGGNDTLRGAGGNDTLFGGGNDDSLTGGRGNDFLSGDFGNDTLTGSAGEDLFYFEARTASSGLDVVTDFTANDTLVLDGITNAVLAADGADVELFINGVVRVTFTDAKLANVAGNVVDGDGDPYIF